MAVEVSDTVPVVAFGYPVPLFQDKYVKTLHVAHTIILKYCFLNGLK